MASMRCWPDSPDRPSPMGARARGGVGGTNHRGRWLALVLSAMTSACASLPPERSSHRIEMPVLAGWFEGRVAWYITTDVSDATVAQEKGANHAPRLADSLPPAQTSARPMPGARNPVDKVYAFTNFKQGSVFASAPRPVGHHSIDKTYSPLWEMITVTWRTGVAPRTLTSEEQVLDAQEKDQVTLGHTRVVVNCPIVQMGDTERLFGVVLK